MKRQKAIWSVAGGPMQVAAAREGIERGFKFLITGRNPACLCSRYAGEVVGKDGGITRKALWGGVRISWKV